MTTNCLKMITAVLGMITLSMTMTRSLLAEEVMRVFIFAGQSNMVGSDAHADRINDYPNFKNAGEPQNDVLYSYILGNGDEASKGWQPLKPLRSFGPEVTFARRVRQQSQFPIGIIKSAVGGTTVAFDWNPDAPDKGQKLYPRTLKLIRESLQELINVVSATGLKGSCGIRAKTICSTKTFTSNTRMDWRNSSHGLELT